jgi:hypothetical protein
MGRSPAGLLTHGPVPDVDLLQWIAGGRRPRPRPGDGSVRRVLAVDAEAAARALAAFLGELVAHGDPSAVVAARAVHARLVLPAAAAGPGLVHLRHRLHPVRVVLVVEPWSALRTDLRLDRIDRPHRSARAMEHWYEGAHAVLDRLRGEIGLRVGAFRSAPEHRPASA